MLCFHWWALEALVLMAGLLPNPHVAVAVVAICKGLRIVVLCVLEGLSGAVAIRVSNALGKLG